MSNLSENYRLRKYLLQKDVVPTISMMKKKMSPALADIYFKSMSPQLKVVAGFEPPMKGGGKDWILAPDELLKGRAVLKPIKKEHISRLHWNGVDEIGMRLAQIYRDKMLYEKERIIEENNLSWQKKISVAKREERAKSTNTAVQDNARFIKSVVKQFELMYALSLSKLQDILFDSVVNKIKASREEAFQKMQARYEYLLKQQAILINERFTKKLTRKTARLKSEFIHALEINRSALGDKLHDINVEKHVAVEKLRHFLKCQALACQVYVAMKERKECVKEMEITKQRHAKNTNTLTDNIEYADFEILLAKSKEQKLSQYMTMWKKKVCLVVKKFQLFISFCLKAIPEHTEFFTNMEKLMMIQLSEALADPTIHSIIIMDVEQSPTPLPRPDPFYLLCDKSYKPKVDQSLCRKHCTSSTSQMPVVVINKRCIYAACDNFEQYTDKIKDYVQGRLGDVVDFEDNHDYTINVPVKYTSSAQLFELKLESSLLQVLQQELGNVRGVPIVCTGCKLPQCFCSTRRSSSHISQVSVNSIKERVKPSLASIYSGNKITTRDAELEHQREPKWDNYLTYVESKKCDCAKVAKRHLLDNLPIYMTKMSTFTEPELLNYEVCSLESMKDLVKKARAKGTPSVIEVPYEPKRKDMATQCFDYEFESLCTCFCDDSMLNLLTGVSNWSKLSNVSSTDKHFHLVGDSMSSTHLTKEVRSFATDRAFSLRQIIDQSPDIMEIFHKEDCVFP